MAETLIDVIVMAADEFERLAKEDSEATVRGDGVLLAGHQNVTDKKDNSKGKAGKR